MSACTNDPHQGHMKNLKFGGLQKLHAGYLDGWINIVYVFVNILQQ